MHEGQVTSTPKRFRPQTVEMSFADIEALITRVEQAITSGQSLGSDDLTQLLAALKTLMHLHERLDAKDLTLAKLRRLLGMVPSAQSRRQAIDEAAGDKPQPKGESSAPHGKRKASDFEKAKVEHHQIQGLGKGHTCPACRKGRLYKYEPAQFVRISAEPPLQATVHVSERLRCSLCQEVYKAPLPAEVTADGADGQRFGYSARSLIVISKYAAGTPWFRQHKLQDVLGVPVSASTLWDQCEAVANAVKPVFSQLKALAGQASLYYCDDTRNRILGQEPVMRPRRGSKKEQLRTGINTSAIIAVTNDRHVISLFKTGINHAGEFLDEILAKRPADCQPPIQMSDGLAANVPTVAKVIPARCNAHARRQFTDIASRFPDEAAFAKGIYERVYANDKVARKQGLDAAALLAWHREKSRPIMEELFSWAKGKLARREAEPNSPLGIALEYIIKREKALMAFCDVEGAPLDNNEVERLLKRIVLHRKNALFFKETTGAAVADILTSVAATAIDCEVNIMDYLTHLQRETDAVRRDPNAHLPWTYHAAGSATIH